jgi:hypothetical protein
VVSVRRVDHLLLSSKNSGGKEMIKKITKNRPYVITDGMTQSMLGSFLTCRQRARYELDGWEPVFMAKSANRGNLIHKALELWYREKPLILAEEFAKIVGNKWKATLIKKGPIDAEAVEETLTHFEALFPEYVRYHAKSDAKIKWTSLEQVFDAKWNGYRLRGKMDGLFQFIKTDGDWLFETKSKAYIEEDAIMDTLAFDFQNLFYLTVSKELGRPLKGVLYNIIRSPNLRRGKKESPEQFSARLKQDIKERPEHYFKRYEVAYSKPTITRFTSELQFKLQAYDGWSRGELPTYRSEVACIGKMKCPFLSACASGSMQGYSQTRQLFSELKEDEWVRL